MNTLDAGTATSLVQRIAAGEAQAETELVERCGRALRFLCRRFTRNEADGQDLYQETLIVALQKIRQHGVREPERLAGFLRTLAKNLSIQRYRLKAYEVEKPTDALPERADEGQTGQLDSLLHLERSSLTRDLLATLKVPRDREILFRYYIAEESSEAICADLGMESHHFYRVLHRARQRYRRIWEEKEGPT